MAAKSGFGWVKWLIVLAVLGGGGWYGWRYYQKENNKPIEYRSGTVTRGDVLQQVTANGQIVPVKSVAVGTQVSGIIQNLYADFNSHVTNGQIVAVIDPSTYQQNLISSEADLAVSQAALEYADLNYKRAKDLWAAKLISASDNDKAVVDLHQAQATLKIKEASVSRAKVDLERTTVYAPIDGIVISRVVDVGQTVAASLNAPTLFTIANDLAKMQIEAMVSEADVGNIAEGQSVTFTVDAFQGRTFRGHIQQLRYMPITNQNVVNYTTVVDVNNADLKLRPGMTAYANVITAEKNDVLRIPSSALAFRPPTNAVVTGVTNVPGRGSGGGGNRADAGSGGGGAGRQGMTPEERDRMRAMRGAGGGGGGGGGGARLRNPDAPLTRTIYLLKKRVKSDGEEEPILEGVSVKVGITDGTFTELVDGLKEGDVVVTGIVIPLSAQGPGGRSPFGSPFGGPGGGRGPGGGGGGGRGGGR